MSIEFRCPQCEKLLRVTDEAAGAKAKCPQCGAIVEVPGSESAEPDEQGEPSGLPPSQGATPLTKGTQPAAEPDSNDRLDSYDTPASGYQPASSELPMSGEVVATSADVGQVINYAWGVWKSNLGILVAVAFVVLGISIGLTFMQLVIQAVFAEQGEEGIGLVIGGVINIFNALIETFLGIGQAHIALKLLRGQRAEFGDLFGGGPLYLRVLGASILAGFALVAGMFACLIPFFILLIIFWPFYWLLVDRKATAIESFGMASPLGQANVGTTIVLILASVGIALAGVLACCFGLLFAVPLISLIWGTAYLMMSGQIHAAPQS